MRKSLVIPFLLLAIAIFLGVYFRTWFLPNTFVSGLGATSKDQENINTSQSIKFNATIKNRGHYPVYVKDTQVNFIESVKSNSQSGDTNLLLVSG
ncbi:hypothetical protein [Paenibacillus sp. MMO-58]|uniref:hypothetical protein n=1 Tax=Paenibacillus sp. MMO-58 TaxID=3081290 RepID=UPI00301847E1